MAKSAKRLPLDRATFVAAAKARGIKVPGTQVVPALAGANWLRDCIGTLRKAGFK